MDKTLISRPLTQTEFEKYKQELLVWYTKELIFSEIYTEDNAAETALKEVLRLCPNGLESPNCYFQYLINDTQEEVGFLWYCIRKIEALDENDLIFICDLKVFDNYRSQGYGKSIMEYVETKTRGHNLNKIILNIFNENNIARSLYDSLGYIVLQEGIGSAAMLKELK